MSNYTNTSTEDFFRTIVYEWNYNYEAAWLASENLMEMRTLFIKWFEYIEKGEADNIYPDPFFNKAISQEQADDIIQEIEKDFEIERGRWKGLGVTTGPGYTRLAPHSRIAFIQEISKKYKDRGQILKEVEINKKEISNKIPEYLIKYYEQLTNSILNE